MICLESPFAADARSRARSAKYFSQLDLYKSFQTVLDTQMYLE